MNLYIACGLTHVPRGVFPDYANYIHRLATALRDIPRIKSVRYALVDSDPQLASKPPGERAALCYAWDRRLVEQADVLLADATFPSTGLGIELQIAEAMGKPVILLIGDLPGSHAEPARYQNPDRSEHELQIGKGIVSLMALGLPAIRRVIEYVSFEQAIAVAVETIGIYVS